MSPIIGLAGICFAIYFVFTHKSPGFSGFFDAHAVVLIGIMPPCIMLLSHTLVDFLIGLRLVFSSIFSRQRHHHDEVIQTLTNASKAVRSEGLGAVVGFRDRSKYALLRDGLSLVVNDFKPEEIRHNLMARINQKQGQMAQAANLFENMSKVCPGVGMIGTLIGLIGMLANMADPAKIGSNMAMAMITTLYGLFVGTILYAPCGERIALEAERTLEMDLLVLEGVLNVKGKKSSAHLRDLVRAYGTDKKDGKGGGGGGEEGKRGA